MDPLTHTATGLFLSRAGLNRWTPQATAVLILAANAPDVDIVTAAGGPLAYLHYHRHLTHSLLALPVMALLAVVVVRMVGRKPLRWRGAFLGALIAVASHLLLDLTNVYGVRLLLPFSARWLRLDLTSVIDLWIWAALGVAVAGPFLGRLVGSEIASASRRQPHYGRGFAWAALFFLLAYNLGHAVLHSRAVAVLDARLYRDAEPLRAAAFPHPADPLHWTGLVETREFYALAPVNLAGEFDPARAAFFPKAAQDPAISAARQTRPFQVFLGFSQYPLWRVSAAPAPENARLVELYDLRFGTPADPAFVATALVGADQRVLRSSFQFGPTRPR